MTDIIFVKAITGSSQEKVEQFNNESLKVWTRRKPIKGEANKAIIKLISKYLNLPKSKISIIKGISSTDKIVMIDE